MSRRAQHMPLPISEMEKGEEGPVHLHLGSAEAHQLMLAILHTGISVSS